MTEQGSSDAAFDAANKARKKHGLSYQAVTLPEHELRIIVDAALAAADKVRGDWTENYKLPCDVRLPPATTIKAGCSLKTLIVGLINRETIYQEKPHQFAEAAAPDMALPADGEGAGEERK